MVMPFIVSKYSYSVNDEEVKLNETFDIPRMCQVMVSPIFSPLFLHVLIKFVKS